MRFTNRQQAGERLAEELSKFKGKNCAVYAIPRGGVELGRVIADRLEAPLDLVIVRKIGHPHNPEYAVCVVAEDKHEMCNEGEIASIDKTWLEEAKAKERAEAVRRRREYLSGRDPVDPAGKTAIVVDDGIATGMTFIVALRETRERKPAHLVAAVPVMPAEFMETLKRECDEVVCLNSDAAYLGAVGAYYGEFPQVSDEAVKSLMR